MTAHVLLLAAAATVAGPHDRPRIVAFGPDPATGILVNCTPGARPFDPPDASRPTVVLIHGVNPAPHLIHYPITQRLGESFARRGGAAVNVLGWDWNAAARTTLNSRVHDETALRQGRSLAAVLMARGLAPGRTHLIGQSSGTIVAASAARTWHAATGQSVAQITLLDPATFYHDVVFDRCAVTAASPRVDNVWAPGVTGFGRAVPLPGVRNVRVDVPRAWLVAVDPLRAAHLQVVYWYLGTVEDRARPDGYNASVFALDGS